MIHNHYNINKDTNLLNKVKTNWVLQPDYFLIDLLHSFIHIKDYK